MPTTDTSKTTLDYLRDDLNAVCKRLDDLDRDIEAYSFGDLRREITQASRDAENAKLALMDLVQEMQGEPPEPEGARFSSNGEDTAPDLESLPY